MAVLPIVRDGSSAPFFDAAAAGRLIIRSCQACGLHWAPHLVVCPSCGHEPLDWVATRLSGSVVTWTTIPGKARAGEEVLSTTVLVVELDQGPWLTVQGLGFNPNDLEVGLMVGLEFERPPGGEAVPVAVPIPGESK